MALGLNAYDEIIAYFGRKIAGRCSVYDKRITRFLWEHKRLMGLRLARLQAQLGFSPERLEAWVAIERAAYWIHLQALAGSRRGEGGLFAGVCEKLAWLREEERPFLTWLCTIL